MKSKPYTLTFARCACPAIHWGVSGVRMGCADCGATSSTMLVVTRHPRKVKREIEEAKSMPEIVAIIERENAALPRREERAL
jgi:hypothetical protein